eukprot:TRINITY_DN15037_c0_g4_i1.p1 TRINITY_DN15037_c0_g4~~TRINITY_DN15037_c0_g4_i1.p1  ORF type:complete len:241 (+),score=87.87 TRINITY_DN15037_c0_g4_i1:81-725(+)
MPLGDFGQGQAQGFDSHTQKVIDQPRRFRQRTKQTPGTSQHTFKMDDPGQPPERPSGSRFASRKPDAGDIAPRREPTDSDKHRPSRKLLEKRPPTALVDDEKIGGHPDASSPRRAGDCFRRMGKKPVTPPVSSRLNVHSPGAAAAAADTSADGVLRIPAKRKTTQRTEYTCLRVGQEFPDESPRRDMTAKRVSKKAEHGRSNAHSPGMLTWETP